MLALGGEGEGKRKGLASRLLECCVFPKKNEAFMAQRILEILHRQRKSLALTLGFIPKKQKSHRFSFVLSVWVVAQSYKLFGCLPIHTILQLLQ